MSRLFSESLVEKLFTHTDNDTPLLVSMNCPVTKCNYHCEYCYLSEETRKARNDQDALAVWRTMLDRVIQIKRPLYLAIGTHGEPLVSKSFWRALREIMHKPNILGVWFPSNLSIPIEKFVKGIPIEKLGIIGTLHPSQFKNYEQDFEFFVSQCKWLKEHGADIVVNYVLTPEQLRNFAEQKNIFSKHSIPMTANILKGNYNGNLYPDAYTHEENEMLKNVFQDEPFIYTYMSKKNTYGLECTAGKDMIHVENDGSVYNCPFSREPLGMIFDKKLSTYDKNRKCTTTWCKCHWSIGFIADVVKDYKRTQGIFSYQRRKPGEIGTNPFV